MAQHLHVCDAGSRYTDMGFMIAGLQISAKMHHHSALWCELCRRMCGIAPVFVDRSKVYVVAVQRLGNLKVADGNKLVPADMSGQPADDDIVF